MKNDEIAENCKKLIATIFLSDKEKNDKKNILCVYDTLDNERLVAIFNKSSSCGEMFGMSNNCIDSYVCKGNLVKGRFRLERLMIDDE